MILHYFTLFDAMLFWKSLQGFGHQTSVSVGPSKKKSDLVEIGLRKTQPPTRVFVPFGPEKSPKKCRESVPEKQEAGCAWECLKECSRDP